MSKKNKLVFRVGTGLAVSSMALALGTGCPKDRPPDVNVNTVAPLEEPDNVEQPATNGGTNNGTNSGTNNGTNATNGDTVGMKDTDPPRNVNTIAPTEPAPEPKRVNTIPSKPE